MFVLCKNVYTDTKECMIAWGRNSMTWHYCLFYFFFAPFSFFAFFPFSLLGLRYVFADKENGASHCNDECLLSQPWQHFDIGFWEIMRMSSQRVCMITTEIILHWPFLFCTSFTGLSKSMSRTRGCQEGHSLTSYVFSAGFHSNFVTVWWLLVWTQVMHKVCEVCVF